MGRFSWALQDPARNHPLVWYGTTWDSRRAYLSFFYVCRYRFELALLCVFVDDGSYWWTMISVGLDLILSVGLPGPAAPEFQAVGYCDRKEPDEPSGSEMNDLLFIISSMFGLEFTGKLEFTDR